MGEGPVEIDDELELAAVRRQARRIRGRALLIAVVGSLLLLLLP